MPRKSGVAPRLGRVRRRRRTRAADLTTSGLRSSPSSERVTGVEVVRAGRDRRAPSGTLIDFPSARSTTERSGCSRSRRRTSRPESRCHSQKSRRETARRQDDRRRGSCAALGRSGWCWPARAAGRHERPAVARCRCAGRPDTDGLSAPRRRDSRGQRDRTAATVSACSAGRELPHGATCRSLTPRTPPGANGAERALPGGAGLPEHARASRAA
jgi:hypothetical protein